MNDTEETKALPAPEDSLRRRYAFRLASSVLGLPVSLGTQSIVPRLLGPANYGDFSFLTSFFLQVVAFCDTGLSSAFYSKLSHRQRESGLLRFFWGVTGLLSLIVVCAVLLVFGVGADAAVWPGQHPWFVLLATVWGLLTWYGLVINKVTDAFGLTAGSEVVRFLQKLFGLVLVAGLYLLRPISLTGFFVYQYLILIFLILGWWWILHCAGRALWPSESLTKPQRAMYRNEFATYAAPLFVFQVVGFISGIADRWLLQTFAGSAQQGFFGLSFQIGSLCFLMSGAMAPLFWREMAREHGAGNHEGMQTMFRRQVPLFYAIAAYLSVFVALEADKVSRIVGGEQFAAAAVPIAIMACYPIHQTYGQLNAGFLMATGHTRAYRNIGLVSSTFQLAITFWMLAPARLGGLGLGAIGLALAMVISQFVSVNLQLRFITKSLGLSYAGLLWHQLVCVAGLAAIGVVCVVSTDRWIGPPLLSLGVGGIAYTAGAAALVWTWPSLVSRSQQELREQALMARVTLRTLTGRWFGRSHA